MGGVAGPRGLAGLGERAARGLGLLRGRLHFNTQ